MPSIKLRALEPQDIDTIYEAENDEAAKVSSDNIAPFSRHTLARYIASTIARPDDEHQLRLIAERCDTGATIGILDFYDISILHRRSFIGIYVLKESRRKGYGALILKEAEKYARQTLGLHTLAARILADNKTSFHLFSRMGYSMAGMLPDWHFADGRFHNVLLLHKRVFPTIVHPN